jgi:nicotinamidase/pyrazinamidase
MSMIKIHRPTDALVIVDLQNDFCPGGESAIPHGDKIVPVINSIVPYFKRVFATQDWHPENHISFKTQGGIWPVHCIANSAGADFHPELYLNGAVRIKKGSDPRKEVYSGFDETDLAKRLRDNDVKRIFLAGLATDYCVKATALDALVNGFKVVVVADAIKGVDYKPGDSDAALKEMTLAGALIARFSNLIPII